MKRIIAYWMSAIFGLFFSAGVIAPWLVSNDELPLLIDMFLFVVLVMSWITIFEWIYKKTIKFMEKGKTDEKIQTRR